MQDGTVEGRNPDIFKGIAPHDTADAMQMLGYNLVLRSDHGLISCGVPVRRGVESYIVGIKASQQNQRKDQ